MRATCSVWWMSDVFLLLPCACLVAAGASSNSVSDKPPQDACEHVSVRMVGFGESSAAPLEPDSVVAVVGYARYVLRPDGLGYRRGVNGNDGVFRLPLRAGASLERAYLLIHRCNPVFAFEDGDGVSGSSRVVALNGSTLDRIWMSESMGLNLGPSVAIDGTLYITATGMVAGLDLATGTFRWRYAGLPSSSFDAPIVSDTTVRFPGSSGDTVIVDRATGRLATH